MWLVVRMLHGVTAQDDAETLGRHVAKVSDLIEKKARVQSVCVLLRWRALLIGRDGCWSVAGSDETQEARSACEDAARPGQAGHHRSKPWRGGPPVCHARLSRVRPLHLCLWLLCHAILRRDRSSPSFSPSAFFCPSL